MNEAKKISSEKRPLELYFHIPFCVRKCLYCDFLSFPASVETVERYVRQLIKETAACSRRADLKERPVETIFFGGGTPSLLAPGLLEELLGTIREGFAVKKDAEITLEANPGTFGKEKAKEWRRMGINRLSMGVQSADNEELKRLGRIHTWEESFRGFQKAREAGFDNINLDLMAALPGQTVESWERTLVRTADLEPEHISAYSLIVEEGTPLGEQYGRMAADLERYGEYSQIPKARRAGYETLLPLPGEEADREMYHRTGTFLEERGYRRYEISNYARPGRECRHNVGYWTGRDYLGLGLGAASLLDGARFSVTRSLSAYESLTPAQMEAGEQYEEHQFLGEQERMEEFMFLGLRLIGGIRAADFFCRFGRQPEEIYGAPLSELEEERLLEQAGRGADRSWRLTELGLDVSNRVLARFLL